MINLTEPPCRYDFYVRFMPELHCIGCVLNQDFSPGTQEFTADCVTAKNRELLLMG